MSDAPIPVTHPPVEPLGTPANLELTVPSIKLPDWADPTSITAWIVSGIAAVFGILTTFGVTVPSGTSTLVSTWAGIASIVIGAGFATVNFIRVVILHKAAINNGVHVITKPVTMKTKI